MTRHQGGFLWQRRLVFCLILGLTAFAVLASRAVVQSVSTAGFVHTRMPRSPTDEPDDLPGDFSQRGRDFATSPPAKKKSDAGVSSPALAVAPATVIHADVARRCGYDKPRSFEPLGSFSFWGKTMNSTWPCPTSGMNNQFTMLVALFHCAMGGGGKSVREAAFRFKDITCSPTGGRQGKASYRVGSDDYEYAWMRWSEIFDVERGLASYAAAAGTPERPPSVLCLNDSFTWKEHPSMARCSTNIGHLYGSESYWAARRVFAFRQRYHALARCFVGWAAAGANPAAAGDHWHRCHADDDNEAAADDPSSSRLIGIHVRRGDYEGFCKGIVHNSGKSRFRTPPFVYFGRKATALSVSKQVMRACAPDDRAVKFGLRRALAGLTPAPADGAASGETKTVIAVATNAAGLVATLSADAELKASGAVVSSIGDFVDAVKKSHGGAAPPTWPTGLGGGPVTRTDLSVLDMTALSRADAAILNRYSTFSQSAIDERIIRSPKAMAEGSLAGLQLLWW